jgi:hypothetical protein
MNEHFFVKVALRSTLKDYTAAGTVRLTGGTFFPSNKENPSVANISIKSGKSVALQIQRDLTKPFSIIAEVEDEATDPIEVPAQLPFEMRREVRYSELAAFSLTQTYGHDPKDVCVNIANEDPAVIIPKDY